MQGGDLFRRDRQADGTPHLYDVAGLWGSGNVVTERALREDDTNTVYTMWSGKGLLGPRAGEYLAQYPAIWGRRPLSEFLAAYADEDIECLVMVEAPDPNDACEAPCMTIRELCNDQAGQQCLSRCRADDVDPLTECLLGARECPDAAACAQALAE